jgi:uncharacterized protein (TIGR03435 family)
VRMRHQAERAQGGRRRLFLTTAGVVVVAVPIMFGLMGSTQVRAQSPIASDAPLPSFEAASIKRNQGEDQQVRMQFQPGGRFVAIGDPVSGLITTAYRLKPHEMIVSPEWTHVLSETFNIEAKAAGNTSVDRMRLMIRSLLADRFKLAVHHEVRQMPVYALVLVKNGKLGPQLVPDSNGEGCIDPTVGTPASPPSAGQPMPQYCGLFGIINKPAAVRLTGTKIPLDRLVTQLSGYVERPVVDQTGLSGSFDIMLEFAHHQSSPFQPSDTASASDTNSGPSILTALQEQLGLKLASQVGPVDVLVIDHIEEPSEN